MNQELQSYCRQELKKRLAQCSESQQNLFKRMYSHNNLTLSIDDVVDKMNADRLDNAWEQVRRTIEKNEKNKVGA